MIIKCGMCAKTFEYKGYAYCSKPCENYKAKLKPKRKDMNFTLVEHKVNTAPVVQGNRRLTRPFPGKKKKYYYVNHESSAFYKSKEWKELRYQVIKHHGRECMACGETKGTMCVDHIIPRSKDRSKSLDFNNLQVLCNACNMGKSNLDDTDFRQTKNAPRTIIRPLVDIEPKKE